MSEIITVGLDLANDVARRLMTVRVALANKMARIVWALMARGGVYQTPTAVAYPSLSP